MNHDPMVDEMKTRPPSRWAETVRRAAVLRRYSAVARPTVEDMRRCAEELGCGQRQAYYYVRAWRARASGLPDPRKQAEHPMPRTAPSSTGETGDYGRHEARSGDARRTSKDDADAVDPTAGHGRHVARPFPCAQAVVDCAPLDFDVVDDGRVEPARLLAVLDAVDGRILAHSLLSREASAQDAEEVLLAWDERRDAEVAWTVGVGDGFEFGRRAALAGARPVPPGADLASAGAALLALAGRSLGRVRIQPRRRGLAGPTQDAVPIDAARSAVAAIVAARNSSIVGEDRQTDG